MTLKPIKTVAIGRLLFGKDPAQFHDCMARMLDYLRWTRLVDAVHIPSTFGKAVDMARNDIVIKSLNQFHADAVIWLDTDMIFPDDALVRLVLMANAGYGISAGIYRRGSSPHGILTMMEEGIWASVEDLEAAAIENGGLVKAVMTAGGFSIVRSEVYRALHKKNGHPWYCNWDFFPTAKGACGEDAFFVLRAREIGVIPVVDPFLRAVHWPPMMGVLPVDPRQPEMKFTV